MGKKTKTGLQWACSSKECPSVGRYQPTPPPYELGDSEPCVRCCSGIATVVDAPVGPAAEAAEYAGPVPPIEIGDCGVDLDDCPFASLSCVGCERDREAE